MFDREEIANKLADDGWCPDSTTEYNEEVGGYHIIKEMFISDSMIDDYIAEHERGVLINEVDRLIRAKKHKEFMRAMETDPELIPFLSRENEELDDDDPLWLVNEQIKGLLEGDGAGEGHEDVLAFLRGTGLPEDTVKRIHKALVHGDSKVRP